MGSSFNVRKRLGEHANDLRAGRHINRKLTQCFQSYGLDGMEFTLAQECPVDSLIETETNWIMTLNSYKRGLNCSPTANGAGKKASLETRLKIGAKSRGRKPSQETRRLLSIAALRQSPETRAAAALKRTGIARCPLAVKATALWHTGKKRPESALFNISKSLSKISASDVPAIFEMMEHGFTYKEIAEKFGVSRQTICNVRRRKTVCLLGVTENPPALVSNQSERTKERRSEAHRGKSATEEARMKMSKARKGVAKSEAHRAAIKSALIRHHAAKKQPPAERRQP